MYPQLKSYFQYTKIEDDLYDVDDLVSGDAWTVNYETVRFLKAIEQRRSLLKTFPEYSVDELKETLGKLQEWGFVGKMKRFHVEGIGNFRLTIWRPKHKRYTMAKIWNSILLFSFLPVSLFSWYSWKYIKIWIQYQENSEQSFHIEFAIFGMVLMMFFHELAHMNAGIAYGAKTYEMGIFLYRFLPGAYVLMEENTIKNWRKRVQINLAGVEANLFFSGIFIWLIVLFPKMYLTFYYIAVINIALAVINLLYAGGLDGMHILEVIWKNDRIFHTYFVKRRRKNNINMNDYARGFAIMVLVVFRISLATTIVANIWIIFV